MRVTIKGQVTIPQHIRQKLGIRPNSEVDFVAEGDRVYIVKKRNEAPGSGIFRLLRSSATVRMSTDEIMKLTRGHADAVGAGGQQRDSGCIRRRS